MSIQDSILYAERKTQKRRSSVKNVNMRKIASGWATFHRHNFENLLFLMIIYIMPKGKKRYQGKIP